MRIPFDIKYRDKIESGEYKVVTRDGRSARILCWDRKNVNYPVVTLVTNGDYEFFYDYTLEGRNDVPEENAHDLFIVTPEPEMSEWQTFISGCLQKHGLLDCGAADRIAKESAAELLSLAKQQLLQSGELLTQEHHEKLMETLREECKKDLPRWRNVEADKTYVGCVARYMDVNGDWNYCMSSGKLSDDCQYISIAALEKLPQEDESYE